MFSFDKNPTIDKIRFYFGFFIIGLYVIIGFGFLFTEIGLQLFPMYRQPIGIVLIVYGSFRLYLLIKAYKKNKEE